MNNKMQVYYNNIFKIILLFSVKSAGSVSNSLTQSCMTEDLTFALY